MEKSSNGPVSGAWEKRFLIVAGGQAISIIGSSAVQFSLVWWLASETASPLVMSMATLLAFLPQLLFGPFAGVWIDRLSRKVVVIGADLFVGLVAAVCAVLFSILPLPYWAVCVVLGIRAIGSVFHTPAFQAMIPMLVPGEELVRANGWTQFLQSGAYMLGPVIGAVLYASFPLPVILLTDLVGAVMASICIAPVKVPEVKRPPQVRPYFWGELREGIVIYLSDRRIAIVTLAAAVSMVFFMPLASFYLLMVSDYFQASAWQASIVQILYPLGMMVGAMLASSFGMVGSKLSLVHLGLLVLGAASFLCGILPPTAVGFWLFAVLCLALGASVNLYNVPYIAYVQEKIPKLAQGRAFSFVGSFMSLTMPLGLLIAGPVAERYGVSLWFAIAGVGIVVAAAISAVAVLREGA